VFFNTTTSPGNELGAGIRLLQPLRDLLPLMVVALLYVRRQQSLWAAGVVSTSTC
jgi:hypothetical protein